MNTVDKNTVTDVEFREVVSMQDDAPKPMSLVDTVTFMIEEAGCSNPTGWLQGLHPEALSTNDLNIQRFLINRHWRGLLIEGLSFDDIQKTTNARGCLVEGRWELTDWISHFRKDVIPCAISVNVLQKIDSTNSTTASSSLGTETSTTPSSSNIA